MRGYYTRRLSPMVQDGNDWVPVGGNGLFDGSLELRLRRFAGDWGGALFLDAGNVAPPVQAGTARGMTALDLGDLQLAAGARPALRHPVRAHPARRRGAAPDRLLGRGPLRTTVPDRCPPNRYRDRSVPEPPRADRGRPLHHRGGVLVRALAAALRLAGFALLGARGDRRRAVSAVAPFATSSARPAASSRGAVIRLLDGALAGQLRARRDRKSRPGGVEIRGLRVLDPDGHLVLAVDRARVFDDLTELRGPHGSASRSRSTGPAVPPRGGGGGRALDRARVRAREPRAAEGDAPRGEAREPSGGWLHVRVTAPRDPRGKRLVGRRDGATRLEARDVNVDARGALGPRLAEVALRLRGPLDLPVAAPLSIDARRRRGTATAVRVPRLRAGGAATRGSLGGDANTRTRAGRAALTRLDVARAEVRTFVPPGGGGADLAGTVYAESDGRVASAALRKSGPRQAPSSAAGGAPTPPSPCGSGARGRSGSTSPSIGSIPPASTPPLLAAT